MREDAARQAAAKSYKAPKAKSDAVADKLDASMAALIELPNHHSETGTHMTVTRYWKQGSVDYKKVPGRCETGAISLQGAGGGVGGSDEVKFVPKASALGLTTCRASPVLAQEKGKPKLLP